MTVTYKRPTIDINGFYPVDLMHDAGRDLIRLDLKRAKKHYFLSHMHALARVVVDGKNYSPEKADMQQSGYPSHVDIALPRLTDGQHVQVMINNQPVSDFTVEGGVLKPTDKHATYQLAVSETRALGMGLSESGGVLNLLPYDRKKRKGFDPAKHAPITDVHTHSTAQITAEGMMRAASEIDIEAGDDAGKGMAYPVELLEKLGVPMTAQQSDHTVTLPSSYFAPTAKQGLACEQREGTYRAVRIKDLTPDQKSAITAKIQVMGDETMPFGDFDPQMYRFRNPLAKHPGMARRMLMEIAEDYARNGVEYAELSTSSMMLNTSWLKEMITTVNDIERDGVNVTLDDGTTANRKPHLRFLVAIQRNLNPQTTLEYIERIKYLARHPYIVGADLVGYESNKTRDFHWALSHLAQWASVSQGTDLKPTDGWDMKRDFILRVHAGETGKNPENVRDAISFAKNDEVRVRVAHALNVKLDPEDEKTIRNLAAAHDEHGQSKDSIGVELCPDSNQVFLTKPLVHTAPFKERRNLNAITFLGTDGGGAIATNPLQLAYSAIAAGASLKDLEEMQREERGYIDRQMARETIRRGAYEKLYGAEADAAFLEGYQEKVMKLQKATKDGLPESLKQMTPVLIGGASGESWASLDALERGKIIASIQKLVHSLDPQKAYFVLGRTKNEGVSNILDQVVKDYNRTHPTNQFKVLARYSGAGNEPTSELPESISWIHNIPGELSKVSKSMVEYLDATAGIALFFGGSTFTTEMIEYCHEMAVPFQMFVPKEGMIADKSLTVPDAFQIRLSDLKLDTKSKEKKLDHESQEFLTDKLFVSQDGADKRGTGILGGLHTRVLQAYQQHRYMALNPKMAEELNAVSVEQAGKIVDPADGPRGRGRG